ncbi:unnamed protein product [Effrenium voratum]|uniref:Protein kinase domain-containing protein n=1 Tax=Effrenium voratum TaxID=2562239 RepID=A0AA36IBG9_9DINO|nr:unnamed protein product [Effrenium voratum]
MSSEAYRRDPHRYRRRDWEETNLEPPEFEVELPGQMPDIHQGDPSPPASQPASLTLRVRPGTSQNQMRLGGTPPLPTAKAMRPSSSGGDPALQPLPFSVTLKGAGHRRQSPGNLGDSSVGRRYSDRDEQGRRGIRWVEDVARHYRIAGSVMPSCHAGMEIRHASRATVDQDASSETFVVKLRYKNKSFQGKNEESRWRNNTELILNMPQTNGIARLIDVLEDTKAYYVIMERAGGCDLYECLSGAPERRLPASEAREVLKELLAAVAELHSHGFIHKDLKLENVMLNRPGPKCPSHIRRNLATSPGAGVKLIDFDTVEEWNSTGPKSRHVLGTDQYIAPEAYEGKYSPASDIFAVGVIAFKMLTGSFPYNGRLFDDKPGENWVGSPKMKEIKQKLCDARVSFSHPVFEKDPGAQRLVSRMLAVEEKDRPDAQELKHLTASMSRSMATTSLCFGLGACGCFTWLAARRPKAGSVGQPQTPPLIEYSPKAIEGSGGRKMRRLVLREANVDISQAKIEVEEVEVPKAPWGHVLVKVAAAPVNPSDDGTWKLPPSQGYPMALGNEGSGRVVASGGGVVAGRLVGREVAFFGKSFSQYAVADAMTCSKLPTDVPVEDGCAFYINPFTVVCMVEAVKSQKGRAFIHTAAASQLGQMMVKYCQTEKMQLVNLVRRKEQAEVLRNLGAEFVVDTSQADWKATLRGLIEQLQIRHAFDCIAGDMPGTLLPLLPPGSTVWVYGRLQGALSGIDPVELMYRQKKLEGFLLTTSLFKGGWLATFRRFKRAAGQVCKGLTTTFASEFRDVSLEDMQRVYVQHKASGATGAKIRVRP